MAATMMDHIFALQEKIDKVHRLYQDSGKLWHKLSMQTRSCPTIDETARDACTVGFTITTGADGRPHNPVIDLLEDLDEIHQSAAVTCQQGNSDLALKAIQAVERAFVPTARQVSGLFVDLGKHRGHHHEWPEVCPAQLLDDSNAAERLCFPWILHIPEVRESLLKGVYQHEDDAIESTLDPSSHRLPILTSDD